MARAKPGPGVDQRQSLARVEQQLFGDAADVITLSRYQLRRRIGGGTGGTVYVGYDPYLGRNVAIKLLPQGEDVEAGSSARDRLLREARAAAGLSHPNIVGVYDVGEYRIDADAEHDVTHGVFIVMELLDGVTLEEWIAATSPSWREIVATFVLAGRGLSAAHDLGIVHRDFKPANVLVGHDGRVCVSDFGLALTTSSDAGGEPGAGRDGAGGTGVQGTPLFMSPEQHRGERLDARSDQYGFCAALYTSLLGAAPFSGDTLAELYEAKMGHVVRPSGALRRVPRAIRDAITRGLQPDPDRRFPDVASLVRALERSLHARRRRLTVLAVTACLALTAAAASVLGTDGSACEDPRDALIGIWDDDIRSETRRALTSSGLTGATGVAQIVERGLDAYVDRWSAAREQACVAATSGAADARAAAVAQGTCLDRHLRNLAATSGLLREADAQILGRASELVEQLPPAETCTHPRPSTLPTPSAAAPEDVVRWEAMLARGRGLMIAASYDAALETIRPLIDGDVDADTRARALVLRGKIEVSLRRLVDAERSLTAGLTLAERVGDDATAVVATARLMDVLSYAQDRYDEALRLGELASARIERARLDVGYEARIAHMRGNIAGQRGRPEDAAREFQRVAELCARRCIGRRPMLRAAAVGMGNTELDLGHYEVARVHYQEYLRLIREHLGEGHPELAKAYNNLALLEGDVGRRDVAREHLQRALAIHADVFGPDNPGRATLLHNVANLDLTQGRLDDAERALREVKTLIERPGGGARIEPYMVARQLGDIESARGRYGRAIELYEEAAAGYRDDTGADHIDALGVTHRLGMELCRFGRVAEGLARNREALAGRRRVLGEGHPHVALSIGSVGECLVARGEVDEGLGMMREAVDRWEQRHGDAHPVLAELLLELGQAATAKGRRREAVTALERALEVATRAKDPTRAQRIEVALAEIPR